jgi:hypothetical protein
MIRIVVGEGLVNLLCKYEPNVHDGVASLGTFIQCNTIRMEYIEY